MTDPVTPTPARPARSWSGPLKISAIVVISAIAGAAASGAARHWHHGHHGFMAGPIDPAEVDRRVDWMTKRLAGEVNATGVQQEKLAAIAKSAAKDLLPMRQTMQDAHKQARELLGQAVVDRAAIEKLRADQIANADAATKRLTAALADAAEVLTPEQRKELAEKMPPGRGWWRHKDRG